MGSMQLIHSTTGGESCLQDSIWSYFSWESEEIYRAIRRFNVLLIWTTMSRSWSFSCFNFTFSASSSVILSFRPIQPFPPILNKNCSSPILSQAYHPCSPMKQLQNNMNIISIYPIFSHLKRKFERTIRHVFNNWPNSVRNLFKNHKICNGIVVYTWFFLCVILKIPKRNGNTP